MDSATRTARVNVKAVVILCLIIGLLGGGAFVAHKYRKYTLKRQALMNGLAAYEARDWAEACRNLRRYLDRVPEDVSVLRMYARAQLNVRPLTQRNVSAAIGAQRQLLRLQPDDLAPHAELAKLYLATRDFGELLYVAERWAEADAADPRPRVWTAQARLGLSQPREARVELERLVAELQDTGEQHAEYVDACLLLSRLDEGQYGLVDSDAAITWLDRAIAHIPDALEPLLMRARAYRLRAEQLGAAGGEQWLANALDDLEQASALDTDDPRLHLVLSSEWLAHGRLDRARTELQRADELETERRAGGGPGTENWIIARFIQSSSIALVAGDAPASRALADGVLDRLSAAEHRRIVLPASIRLYLQADQVEAARPLLDEYLDYQRTADTGGDDAGDIILEALVLAAEGDAHGVINRLEPLTARSQVPQNARRMLAQAYDATGQSGRAGRAWARYAQARPDDAAVFALLAQAQMGQRRWSEALELARRYRDARPDDPQGEILVLECRVRAVRARGSADTSEVAALSAEVDELLASYPRQVDLHLLKADLALAVSQQDEARRILATALETCDQTLPAAAELVYLHLRASNVAEALVVARAETERADAGAPAWLLLADVQLESGNLDEVQATLGLALQRAERPDAQLRIIARQTLLDAQREDWQSMEARLTRALVDHPDSLLIRRLLLNVPDVRANRERAMALVNEMEAIEGDSGLQWRLHRALLLMDSSDWRVQEAEIAELLNRCIVADPRWTDPVLLLGEVHERLGRTEQAEAVYEQCVALNPTAADVGDRLFTLYEAEGRFAEAEALLNRLELPPQQRSEREVRLAVSLGDFEHAQTLLEARRVADPTDVTARLDLAQLAYRRTRDAERALRYVDEAADIEGLTDRVAALRAAILRAANRTAKLREFLDNYVADAGGFEAHSLRARVLAALGDFAAAEQDYVKLPDLAEDSRGTILLGMFYAERGRLDDAIATYREALAAAEFPAVRRLLVDALLARDTPENRTEATALLDELEQDSPRDIRLRLVRARLYFLAGTPESAAQGRALLEQIITLSPGTLAAHQMLVTHAMQQGRVEQAYEWVLRGLARNPENPELLMTRARVELTRGDTAATCDVMQQVVRMRPADVEAHILLVEAAVADGDQRRQEAALARVELACVEMPAVEALHVARSRILISLKQLEAARDRLSAFVAEYPEDVGSAAWVALAEVHARLADATAAQECLARGAERSPQAAELLRARITGLGIEGNSTAILVLTEGTLPDPPFDLQTKLTAATYLARALDDSARARAAQILRGVLEGAELPEPVRLSVLGLLYTAGEVSEAEALFREALAADPQNPRILNDLAWILQEGRQVYAEALELANRGLEAAPDDLHLLDTRGVVLSKLPGRLAEARADFERRVELIAAQQPRSAVHAEALVRLGRTCLELGDRARGQGYLREALAIDLERRVFSAAERLELAALLN